MQTLTRTTLALAVGIAATSAFAQVETTPLSAADIAAHESAAQVHAAAAMRNKLALLQPMEVAPSAAESVTATTSVRPGALHANGFRSYPPSCGAVPLPDTPSGPVLAQARVPVFARNPSSGQAVAETVTLSVWRIACSSSGELTPYNGDRGKNAMTLMRIKRDSGANPSYYITYPLIHVTQNGSSFDSDRALLRAALEPNTVVSDTPFSAPLFDSTTFVLEDYPYTNTDHFAFNYPFALRVDPVLNGVSPVTLSVRGYEPTQSDYPDAFRSLAFDGYAAAQWVGVTRPGDGLLMQVSEQWSGSGANATWSRQIVFDLLTRDNNGDPFWLIGTNSFAEGATSVTSDVYYLGKNNAQLRWGKATFSFPHCNRLDVTFTPAGGLPSSVPAISGSNRFSRLFSANGMLCE